MLPLSRKWRSYFWIALVLAIVILSWIGLSLVYPETSTLRYLPDRIFRILKILAGNDPLGSSVEPVGLTWQMIAVKILVIILLLRVVLKVILSVFSEQFTALRAGFKRGHTIVVGAGENASKLLSDYLQQTGQHAVVIEIDGNRKSIKAIREQGHLVVIGDATKEETLRTAGVARASNLICFTKDSSLNAKVDSTSRRVCRTASDDHVINSFLHLNNPRLLNLLPSQKALLTSGHVKTNFFNVDQMIARQFFHQLAIDLSAELQSPGKCWRFLFFGASSTAQALLLQLLRVFHLASKEASECVIFCEKAAENKARLSDRYPQAASIAGLTFVEFDFRYTDLLENYVFHKNDHMDIVAIVAMESDDINLSVANELLAKSNQSDFPIYCQNSNTTALTELLTQLSPQPRLRYFGRQSDFCRFELITAEKQDKLAKAFHLDYQLQVAGASSESASYQSAWDILPEDARDANRAQADHIIYKLILTNKLKSFQEGKALIFTPEECEELAMVEHRRWMAHRYLNGWSFGERRDDRHKLHPSLITWEALSETEKQKDRDTILRLPALLDEPAKVMW